MHLTVLRQRRLGPALDDALAEQLSAELGISIRSFEGGSDRVLGQRALRLDEGCAAFVAIEVDGQDAVVVRLLGREANHAQLAEAWTAVEAAVERAEYAVRGDVSPHGTAIWAPFPSLLKSEIYRALLPIVEPSTLLHWPNALGIDRDRWQHGAGLAIIVRSVDTAVRLAVEHGGEMRAEGIERLGGRCAVVTDPIGLPVMLWERSLEHSGPGITEGLPARVDVVSSDLRAVADFYRAVAGWRTAVISAEPAQAILLHRGSPVGVLDESPVGSWAEVALAAWDPWMMLSNLTIRYSVEVEPIRHALGWRWVVRTKLGDQLGLAEAISMERMPARSSSERLGPTPQTRVAALRRAVARVAMASYRMSNANPVRRYARTPPWMSRLAYAARLTELLSTELAPAVERVIDLLAEPIGARALVIKALDDLRPDVRHLVALLAPMVARAHDDELNAAYSHVRERLVLAALLRDDAEAHAHIPT